MAGHPNGLLLVRSRHGQPAEREAKSLMEPRREEGDPVEPSCVGDKGKVKGRQTRAAVAGVVQPGRR